MEISKYLTKSNIKIVAGIIIILAILWFNTLGFPRFNFGGNDIEPTIPDTEPIIEQIDNYIYQHDTIYITEVVIKKELDTLYIRLDDVKLSGDSALIISTQDTIIGKQKEQILSMETRLELKDLIIEQKDELLIVELEAKDIYIGKLEKEIKKEKRKRIVTMVVSGILITLVVVASL